MSEAPDVELTDDALQIIESLDERVGGTINSLYALLRVMTEHAGKITVHSTGVETDEVIYERLMEYMTAKHILDMTPNQFFNAVADGTFSDDGPARLT